MSELEPVWCVFDGTWWHATASGNAPLSTRSTVACLCLHTAYGSRWSGGGHNYSSDIRLPTCIACLRVLEKRAERARVKVAKAALEGDEKQGVLF